MCMPGVGACGLACGRTWAGGTQDRAPGMCETRAPTHRPLPAQAPTRTGPQRTETPSVSGLVTN